ncbi:MAG TPA: trimeric intracellular cation channel family protein [Bryobacteraceae bacterium]|nr:trimeric intracellular cation channel family protein [Bryobacteraceae bacterium]
MPPKLGWQHRLMVNGHVLINTLLVAFDLGGTFVFALSGATAGVKHRLDLFGVLVLSFAAGNSGGIARDVMIGAHPPAAISDWRYVAVSILAGLITFYWYRIINRLSSPVLVFDAAGLALFAVAGAGKALAFDAGPVAATLLGMLTGIGGGMVRDVLVMEIPTVLRTELYAVAALIGAAAVVIGRMLNVPSAAAAVTGAILCFGLRFLAMRRGWQLPVARLPERSSPKASLDRSDSQ